LLFSRFLPSVKRTIQLAKHVYSTLSANTEYAAWVTQPGVSSIEKKVLVRGGAGVATAGNGPNIYTPKGVRTEVSDEDAKFLTDHGIFKLHQKGGFVTIEDAASDPDKVAENMDADKGGAPKTPADVADEAAKAAKESGLTPNETLQAVTNAKAKGK
jgi:hypothetical protein